MLVGETEAARRHVESPRPVPSLLDKRFLIFSGKGGVGKSTVAAATAVAAARRGKRVLIIEIGDRERIPSVFGAKKAGYEGARIYGSATGGIRPIWSMCLTAREALHEFVIRQLRFERLYEAVFENRVIRYFTAAAPGLDELIVMGKIESLAQERRFDLIVFDAPATGHGLAFFKVPQTTMTMVRMGPLHWKAEKMWKLLTDPARTAFNIVTMPEEMPVNEAIDLHKAAAEIGLPGGKLVVNAVYPDLFEGDDEDLRRLREQVEAVDGLSGAIALAALDCALSTAARRAMHEEMVAKLAAEVPRERVMLPFLFRPRIGPEEIETLADGLEGF